MRKTKPRRRQLTDAQMQQLRREREQIAQESTISGALRRAIHSSKFLLHDLADRAAIDLVTLDAFLTGVRPLGSDVIDRLTKILRLKLKADGGKAKQRT